MSMQDANEGLMGDVMSGAEISEASEHSFDVLVSRDGELQRRHWEVTGRGFQVTTSMIDSDGNEGDGRAFEFYRGALAEADKPSFRYFDISGTELSRPVPADMYDQIVRVDWRLRAEVSDSQSPVEMISAGSFAWRTHIEGPGAPERVAGEAQLRVITSEVPGEPTSREGISDPVLKWNDPTPDMTSSWIVYRTMASFQAAPSDKPDQMSPIRAAVPSPGLAHGGFLLGAGRLGTPTSGPGPGTAGLRASQL